MANLFDGFDLSCPEITVEKPVAQRKQEIKTEYGKNITNQKQQ